jgi:hypothetical protein
MTTQAPDDTNTIATPYIAVAANFYGTGNTVREARKALVMAGGGSEEPQTVIKLPDGAKGAFVSDQGNVHWFGADDKVAQPVFRYVKGKAVAWKNGEDKPLPWLPVTAKTKPRHNPNAQNLGEIHPEPELGADKESTIAETDLPSKPKRARRKPAAELATFGIGSKVQWTSGPMAKRVTKVGEIIHIVPAGQQPPEGMVRDPGDGRATDSFVVKAGNRNYWPHVNSLTAAQPTDDEIASSVAANTAADIDAEIVDKLVTIVEAAKDAPMIVLDSVPPSYEDDKAAAELAAGLEAEAEMDAELSNGEFAQIQAGPVNDEPKPAAPAKPAKAKSTPKASGSGPDGKPGKEATARGRAIADKAKAAPAAKPADEHADFLLFIGGSFYTKVGFIDESLKLGISRRMPSYRLPKGLVCGKSRVFVGAEGVRKTDGTPSSEVFGYFTPERVEFINSDGEEYADIIATLKTRGDTKVIDSIEGEPERACGHRIEGGTYIVVDKGDSPLVMLEAPAKYEGNHFRGMLRLDADQVTAFISGGTVATLVDEVCMGCGAAMKCAPDGHQRAERERKRIEKGDQPKWRLLDAKCQAQVRADRRAAAESAEESPESDQSEGEETAE